MDAPSVVGKVKAKMEEVVVGKKSLTVGEAIGVIVAIVLVALSQIPKTSGKVKAKWAIPLAFAILIICLVLF